MSYLKPSATELKFAYRLLLYLHANTNNTYLLLAIIAWTRSESGQNWRGFNPLNIRNSQYATGYRQTQGNGHFAIFANVDAAAKATAAFLLGNHGNGYEVMVAAARRNGGEKDYAKQAIDFLLGLVVSKWDAGHYGLSAAQLLDPNSLYTTTIYKVWNNLLGHKITLPADTAHDAPKPPPKVKPPYTQPRSHLHTIDKPNYIQPYAAETFYEERHQSADGPPGDPSETGL